MITKSPIALKVAVIAVWVVSALSPVPTGAAQKEVAVHCEEGGISEPIHIDYGEHTLGCEIEQITDVDRFSFSGEAGEDVRLVLSRVGGAAGYQFDVFGPDGDKIGSGFSSGPIVWNHTLEKTGVHAIAIADHLSNATGAYMLQLERIPTEGGPPLLSYDVPLVDDIDPITDIDMLAFEGVKNSVVRFTLSRLGSAGYQFEIYDPQGEKIDEGFSSGPIVTEYMLPRTGTYIIVVGDHLHNATGAYAMELHCLAGACPDADGEIVAIIEQPTCAGVAGVSDIRGVVYTTEPGGEIERLVQVIFDEGSAGETSVDVPCCSSRGDAAELLSGFSGVFNWCLLSPGTHTITLVFESSTGKTLVVTREFVSHCEHPDATFLRQGEFDWRNEGDNCTSNQDGVIICRPAAAVCDEEVRYEWSQAAQGLVLRSGCVDDASDPEGSACSDLVSREQGSIFD